MREGGLLARVFAVILSFVCEVHPSEAVDVLVLSFTPAPTCLLLNIDVSTVF